MRKRISVLFVCAISLTILLCSCGKNKTVMSADDFAKTLEGEGYTLLEATNQFDEGALKVCWLAMKDDVQIEFYVCNSEADAKAAYEDNKESAKGSSGSHKEVSLKNYSEYSSTYDGNYYVISRIDDTFIYVEVPEENKKEVNRILDKIGY